MGLKWIGHQKGVEGLPGIPARDLADDEVEQHGGEAALVATGLYERVQIVKPKIEKKGSENDLSSSSSPTTG